MADKKMEAQISVEFEEATSRQSLNSGETINTLWSKVKRWLSDLKAVAFSGSYNDLSDKPKIPNVDSELSETSENPVQNKVISNAIKGGEVVSGSSSYTIENTVDYPIMGINVYGKSTQNGTPTPENPVDIVSVGDNGFDIISKNDTHFNLLSVRDNGKGIITKQPVSKATKVGRTVLFYVNEKNDTGTGLTYQWQRSIDSGITWDDDTITTRSSYRVQVDASYNGYKYRCVVTDSSGNSETSNEVTLYVVSDDCEITTASITASALPLCGIPVSSGGNYTDSNGQQWICDELIYNADGTGKIIKKTGNIIFDGSEDWSKSGVTEIDRYIIRNVSAKKGIRITSGLCNTYIVDVSETSDTELGKILLYPTQYDQISVNFAEYGTSTVETFKAYLKNNPIVLYTDLIEPQEIELTAAEMTALRQLQTFNGTTSISNDAGTEMNVKYCTNKALSEYVLPIMDSNLTNLKTYTDTKVESLNSTINTKANESDLTSHTGNTSNPHSVTKAQVGLGNVPNVTTNDQTPSYTEASSLTKLTSGEKLSVAFGKVSKAITDLITHIEDSVKHITSTERANWNAAKTHADSAHAPSNAQVNVIETVKVNGIALTPSSKAVDITVPSIGNGTITIKQAGTTKGTFTTNQSGNTTIELANTTYGVATTSANGLMSAADKKKFDLIQQSWSTLNPGELSSKWCKVASVTIDKADGNYHALISISEFSTKSGTLLLSWDCATSSSVTTIGQQLLIYMGGSGTLASSYTSTFASFAVINSNSITFTLWCIPRVAYHTFTFNLIEESSNGGYSLTKYDKANYETALISGTRANINTPYWIGLSNNSNYASRAYRMRETSIISPGTDLNKYYKIATLTLGAKWADKHVVFIATESSIGQGSFIFTWDCETGDTTTTLLKNNLSYIAGTSGTANISSAFFTEAVIESSSITFNLWFKPIQNYQGYAFSVIHETGTTTVAATVNYSPTYVTTAPTGTINYLSKPEFPGNAKTVNNHTVESDVPADAKFTWRDVVDNLTSTDATKSLSANQGKVLKGLVDGKAASNHNQASNTITAMTGYAKASSAAAISASDSLNTAIGKLEKALDTKGTSNLTIGTTASTAAAGNHTHNYLPLTGGTVTGTIALKPDSGEGGQLELDASSANTSQNGIILDQYNGNFRIFGKASADGTSVTGTGTTLYINPYSKTISGDYYFNGTTQYSNILKSAIASNVGTGKVDKYYYIGSYLTTSDEWKSITTRMAFFDGANFSNSGDITISARHDGTNNKWLKAKIYVQSMSGDWKGTFHLIEVSSTELQLWVQIKSSDFWSPTLFYIYGNKLTLSSTPSDVYDALPEGTDHVGECPFYGNLAGNASTANKLATARTISLTGSITGSGSFDGSGNLSIATTTNHSHTKKYTVSISASESWTSGTSCKYITKTVTGLKTTDDIDVTPVLSTSDHAAAALQLEAYKCILNGNIVISANDTITIYCYGDTPTTALTLDLITIG